ncbi:metallophosphoesterase family protein [Novosphingobium sp. M1R2S20]|uniref:Metallophosphoesterase n=1 Tax=Novosphingobium rhizovicinum TaxID=3228928 RepID=A0ABV3RG17_9SPHN
MRIAMISDVHAVASAFEDALCAARAEGFDELLILGDLLTYGIAPTETLELAAEAVQRDGAVLLMGNHDQLYLDLADGKGAYRDGLPEWLRESVDWTAQRTDADALRALPWQQDWRTGPIFTAHANPFAFGDWTYLNDDAAMGRASAALYTRGARYGVFGHTHRSRRYNDPIAEIHTLPSLGQPRDRADQRLYWTMAELRDELTLSSRPVAFDRKAHCRALHATSMSSQTKSHLCSWFL